MMDNNKNNKSASGLAIGMCLGLAFGHNHSGDDNDETKKWFHHTQMDGAHAGKFLMNLQNEINNIKSVTRRRK